MDYTISVVTICFNNLEELLVTCQSVDQQSIHPFEHLIIDGSTKPGIREYLDTHPQPSYRKWSCEPDQGIADAFNKGIHRATGTILNLLNSGDSYSDNKTLEIVTDQFRSHPGISWLHSKYRIQRAAIWVIIGKPFDPHKLYRGMRSLSHQSIFLKKELHDKYGEYDLSLKNAMDFDFVCRISREPFVFIDQPLVTFAPGGTTYQHYFRSLAEARKVYEKYFGFSFKLVLWQWRLKILYYLLNSPAGKLLYKIKVWLRLENM